MRASIEKRRVKAGMPGGVLIESPKVSAAPVTMTVFRYGDDAIEERSIANLAEVEAAIAKGGMLWVDVNGVHDAKVIEGLGDVFKIHSLVLEDIADTAERPKADDYEDYLYVTLKMVQRQGGRGSEFYSEQVSIIVGPNYLISFQEREKDLFDSVRERLRNGKGKIRRQGPDFLLYALMDAIVDGYYAVLEDIGEELEDVEDEVVASSASSTFQSIHDARQKILVLRRFTWPLRDMLSVLERSDTELIQDPTRVYLRDVYDHAVEIIDIIENSRDECSSLIDVYLSSQSNRLNEVMKVLTIIATIFMPISWIASVFGMNFELMPGLHNPSGFYACMAGMLLIAVGMLYYFRVRKWI